MRAVAGAPERTRASVAPAGAFASVDVFCDPLAALADWRALAPETTGSFYQSERFVLAWLAHFGRRAKVSPFFIVARDAAGAPVALLPLGLFRFGPLRVAQFLGDRHSNYNLGLFRADCALSGPDIMRLLRLAARKVSRGPHLYRLFNMPLRWHGANPLAALPHRPSAGPAYATALGEDGEAWLAARLSPETRKKLRKKEKRLAGMGALRYFRASGEEQTGRILDAFFAQKSQRYRHLDNPAEVAATRAFFDELMRGDDGAELHALALDDKIVASFAAGRCGDRLQGMFNAFDADPEIARSSPGDLLLTHVLRDACARKLTTFDLGVGDARYKTMFCDEKEPMADALFAVGLAGALAAPLFHAAQAAKVAIKRNKRLYAALGRGRRA